MKKKILIFFVILFVQLALYLFLYQRANAITPPGHIHALDNADTFYPDVIRQSKFGAWNYRYAFSSLPAAKVYTLLFFIVAGKFAAVFHIDPVVMYEITRVTGGIATLTGTFWLITLLVPVTLQIPAMIFTMVFDTGPLWTDVIHAPIWQWTAAHPELILLFRRFWLPHHLWGEALGLALFCVILKTIKKTSWINPILIIVLAVAGPLCDPTYDGILVTCVFIPWLMYAAITKTLKRTAPPIICALAGIGCVVLFTKSQFSVDPRLANFLSTEKTWWTNEFILSQFVQSFGLFYPFVIILLLLVPFGWKKWSDNLKRSFTLSFTWAVLPVGLIFLSVLPWTPLVNGRIGMDISTVPIGILCAHIFYAATQFPWYRRIVKYVVNGLFLLGIGFSLFLSIMYFRQIMQSQNDDVNARGNSWTIYPSLNLWNGMMALKKVPLWSHIMINPRVGDVLPAFVPIIVYQGNPSYGDIDWIPRRSLSYEFYRGDMSRDRLRLLLKINNISYVFYGTEEKTSTVTPNFYPDILEPIYSNPEVTIYKVRTSTL